jgi:broad specificity phosphatase PhoE
MRIRTLALLASLALTALPAGAQTAVFVVRHAEKVSEKDERLTDSGKARAQRLASMLKDSGIAAIFSTDTERTIGTAKPLADALARKIELYKDVAPLMQTLRERHGHEIVLVVGHSNTVPGLLKSLGCAETVTIADDEYDNLFVVVPNANEKALLIRLRY